MSRARVDLSTVVDGVTRLIRRVKPPDVQLVIDLAPELWVEGDAGALQHVLMNLCTNGLDALPGPGTLHVAARRSEDGRWITLNVSDTGSGMDDATRRRALDPYFTTKPLGTGLGLSLVGATVREHSGELSIESEVGAGTVVRVRLPAASCVPAAEPRRASPPVAQLAVLVVEDDRLVRRGVLRMLRALGHHPVESHDVASARLALAAVPADVALVDVMLRGGSGIELAEELARTVDGRLPVVFMSGLARPVETPMEAEWLPKPFDAEELQLALDRAARRRIDVVNLPGRG